MKFIIVLSIVTIFVTLTSASISSSSSSSSTSENVINNSSRQARFEERRFRYDQEKKEISNFLNTKNILKTIVKLLFGNNEESTATSRQVLSVLVKVLDMVRNSFTQKARSAQSRSLKEAVDDAAVASTSLLSGFIRSLLTKDDICMKKYLCESSKTAARDAREIGYLISQVGGYASSYLLENQKSTPFDVTYEAIRKGRSGEDCAKLYQTCNETE